MMPPFRLQVGSSRKLDGGKFEVLDSAGEVLCEGSVTDPLDESLEKRTMMTGISLAPAPSQDASAFGNLIILHWLKRGDKATVKALKSALRDVFDVDGVSSGDPSATGGSTGGNVDGTTAGNLAFSLVWHSVVESEIPDRPDLILQVGKGNSTSDLLMKAVLGGLLGGGTLLLKSRLNGHQSFCTQRCRPRPEPALPQPRLRRTARSSPPCGS